MAPKSFPFVTLAVLLTTWATLATTHLLPAELPELANVKQTAVYEVTGNWTGNVEDGSLPEEYDFRYDPRNAGKFTEVKWQGNCSSCWAHAAVTVYESYFAKRWNTVAVARSPQELMECSRPKGGRRKLNCDTGYPELALNYIKDHGLHTEKNYPYKGENDTYEKCYSPVGKVIIPVDLQYRLYFRENSSPHNLEDVDLMRILYVNQLPLIVEIRENKKLTDLKHDSGVLRDDSNPYIDQDKRLLLHDVVLTGWGTDRNTGIKYWLLRNSWGTEWGEAGYFRIARGGNLFGIKNKVIFICYGLMNVKQGNYGCGVGGVGHTTRGSSQEVPSTEDVSF